MSKFLDTKVGKVVTIIVAFLLVVAVFGGLVALTGNLSVKGSSSKPVNTTVAKTSSSSGTGGSSSGSSSGNSSGSSSTTRYTLTYVPGNFADGETNCPFAVTVDAGQTVTIDFTTHPTRSGYSFVGWARSDGADNPDFYDSDRFSTITMNSNETLFPVFSSNSEGSGGTLEEEEEEFGTLLVYNVGGSNVTVTVIHDEDKSDVVDLQSLSSGNEEEISLTHHEYTIKLSGEYLPTVTYIGEYKGFSYDSGSPCILTVTDGTVYSPTGDSWWQFYEEESGELQIGYDAH